MKQIFSLSVLLCAALTVASCGGRNAKNTTTGAAAATDTTAVAQAADTSSDEADATEATTLVKAGMTAPDFTALMSDGSSVRLSSLRGKTVLIDFWATWCPYCCQELARVQKEIIDRFAGKDFVFLPISRGEKQVTVDNFLTKQSYKFISGLDADQSIFKRYATDYIPRNILIDKEGKVVLSSVGYDDDEFAALVEQIAKTLE